MEPQDLPEASLAANVSGAAGRAGVLKGVSTSRVAATPPCMTHPTSRVRP